MKTSRQSRQTYFSESVRLSEHSKKMNFNKKANETGAMFHQDTRLTVFLIISLFDVKQGT